MINDPITLAQANRERIKSNIIGSYVNAPKPLVKSEETEELKNDGDAENKETTDEQSI